MSPRARKCIGLHEEIESKAAVWSPAIQSVLGELAGEALLGSLTEMLPSDLLNQIFNLARSPARLVHIEVREAWGKLFFTVVKNAHESQTVGFQSWLDSFLAL
uniref:Uncharacterized protein n=1 Tax=Piliocolobus tephrosceles TaxID=591936 RepID=A0A8C9HKM5_9PRIM